MSGSCPVRSDSKTPSTAASEDDAADDLHQEVKADRNLPLSEPSEQVFKVTPEQENPKSDERQQQHITE